MKVKLTTLCIFLLVSTFSEARHKSFGGKYAHDDQFPYAATVTVDNISFCGVSIIHERWALTAAHCIDEGEAKRSYIGVGSMNRYYQRVIGTKEFFTHPDFVEIPEDENDGLEYIVNDIGLIRLSENITFNNHIQPITLATEEDGSFENSIATVAGWGRASLGAFLPKVLRYINVRVLTHEDCRKGWPYADKHVCTSNQEQQGVCYGDSGSALVVGNKQIGIVSTSDTYCQSLKPDLYTKVASFVPWIKSIMSQYGDVLPDA